MMRQPLAPILTIFLLPRSSFVADLLPRQNSFLTPTIITRARPTTSIDPLRTSASLNGPTTTSGVLSSPSTTSSISSSTSLNGSTSNSSSTLSATDNSTDLSITSSTSIVQTSQVTSLSPTVSSTTTLDSDTSTSTTTSISTTDGSTSPATFSSPITSNTANLTVTAIVATSGTSDAPFHSISKAGFFSSAGAVAGTFLVVGLFGTSFLLCLFFWARRKYRSHIENRRLYDDEYWQFSRSAERGITPEPAMQETSVSTPVTPSPSLNVIERSHGNETSLQYPSYDNVTTPFQAEPGEFNPYHPRDAAYAFSTPVVYIQVPDDTTDNYGRRRSAEGRTTPENHSTVVRPSHRRSSSSHSFNHDSDGRT